MSLLFDTLRRGRQTARSDSGTRRTVHADAVLATLGYAPERKRDGARMLGRAVAAVALVAGGWAAWTLYSSSIAARPVASAPQSVQGPPNGQGKPLPPPRKEPAPQTTAPAARVEPPRTTPLNAVTNGPAAASTRTAALPAASRPAPAPSGTTPDARTSVPEPPAATPASAMTNAAAADAGSDDFQLALYYQRAADFDNALIHYRALLQRSPMHAQARNNLGLLYQSKGMLDEAISEFQRALYIDTRYLRARNNLGVALLNQGNVDAASAEFRSVLAQDPSHVDALVNLALAEKAAARPEQAKETLLRALVIDRRSAPAHYNLAVLFEATGEAARAVEHYRAFLEHAGTGFADRAPEVRARLDVLSRGLR